MSLVLRSPSFSDGAEIPAEHTCEGRDASPPLTWSGAPAGTRSFALIVDDPDAPDPAAPKMTWVHWVLYGIPADASSLPGTARTSDLARSGIRTGLNDWRRDAYGGPCPPIGEHRYYHKLYALDVELGDLGKPTKAELESAMKGHVLAQATLLGRYRKKKGDRRE